MGPSSCPKLDATGVAPSETYKLMAQLVQLLASEIIEALRSLRTRRLRATAN
jgi:hypothetical protein